MLQELYNNMVCVLGGDCSDGCAGREPSQLKTRPIVERFFLVHAETRTVNDS